VELSSTKVSVVAGSAKESEPEPSVVKTWLAEPSPSGNVNVVLVVTALGALSAIKFEPLFVPSFS